MATLNCKNKKNEMNYYISTTTIIVIVGVVGFITQKIIQLQLD